jgi:hypothetical protein
MIGGSPKRVTALLHFLIAFVSLSAAAAVVTAIVLLLKS